MNLYRVIVVVGVLAGAVYLLGVGPAIAEMVVYLARAIATLAMRLAEVPTIEYRGPKPHLFNLGVLLAYLIALVGIIKIIFGRRK